MMVFLCQLCFVVLIVVAVATGDRAVRRKRLLISIDLEESAVGMRRGLKHDHDASDEKHGALKKGSRKKEDPAGNDGGGETGTPVEGVFEIIEMSMSSMSFSYSPIPQPPMASPTVSPTANTAPTVVETLAPAANESPTTAPDCLAGSDRGAYLMDTLSSITDPAVLLDPLSPQGMAYDWMKNVDTAVDVCTYSTLNQRYAMATFYFSTNGDGWTKSAGWLTNVSECYWELAICNADGVLTGLYMTANNLSGSITHEFSILSSMKVMKFFTNSLTGSLPSLVGFTDLTSFDVEVNLFTGPAFGDLSDVLNLKSYLVSGNMLTGTIPEELGTLGSLEDLWMERNEITGTIPVSIGRAINLKNLLLGENRLAGQVPSEMKGLVNLESFYANGNDLTGTLPADLIQSSNFNALRLHNNNLQGLIPTLALPGLKELWLQNNTFTGTIPSSLALSTSLEFLLLGNNALSGTIPSIGAPTLSFIDLRNNKLAGEIPSSFFATPDSLEFVYLQGNMLVGTLPSSFTTATKLTDLYLSSNLLTGTIPDVPAGSLLALQELLLDGNNFDGSMPESVCALRDSSLEDLWSDCATLVCSLPDCCTQCFPV